MSSDQAAAGPGAAPLSEDELAEDRADHVPTQRHRGYETAWPVCAYDGADWPCDVARYLATLDRERARVVESEARRLRLADWLETTGGGPRCPAWDATDVSEWVRESWRRTARQRLTATEVFYGDR